MQVTRVQYFPEADINGYEHSSPQEHDADAGAQDPKVSPGSKSLDDFWIVLHDLGFFVHEEGDAEVEDDA